MAGTNNSHPPEVAELLSARAGEEMALNDRHLNPQLGRICARSASTATGSRPRART